MFPSAGIIIGGHHHHPRGARPGSSGNQARANRLWAGNQARASGHHRRHPSSSWRPRPPGVGQPPGQQRGGLVLPLVGSAQRVRPRSGHRPLKITTDTSPQTESSSAPPSSTWLLTQPSPPRIPHQHGSSLVNMAPPSSTCPPRIPLLPRPQSRNWRTTAWSCDQHVTGSAWAPGCPTKWLDGR